MKVVFYAPLKPLDHPVPSGDRQLAQALLQALRAAGHFVSIASRFRSFDGRGDAARQARLSYVGGKLARRLIARFQCAAEPPDVWFTYHLYHKAPDWLGPSVCRALGIAYVVAEASVAAKQRHGPWAWGYAGSIAAVKAADAVLYLNPVDVEGIQKVRGASAVAQLLPPFLDLAAFAGPDAPPAPAVERRGARVRLITVAMMRPGAKLASYRLLATALTRIAKHEWDLVVVGDGPARPQVEAAFAGIGRDRVRFAGAQPAHLVAALLREADLFVWPAIDEAFGMVFIEAQACGLAVVGGNSGGVAAVVAAGRTGLLVAPGDAEAFAEATLHLLREAEVRQRMGREARAYVRSQHDLPAAAARLDVLLRRAVANRAAVAARVATATR
ncbi:MAG: glycosyltransferase family 4 protein [Betaproteobacteria bacterium]|nr:glycosyltransferase family 4 protein [Betaproteobacteria bacterium]